MRPGSNRRPYGGSDFGVPIISVRVFRRYPVVRAEKVDTRLALVVFAMNAPVISESRRRIYTCETYGYFCVR